MALLSSSMVAYGQEIHCNYDHGSDFTTYKTYQWVPPGNS